MRPGRLAHWAFTFQAGEQGVRTVRDSQGTNWICLELPEVPAERQAAAAGVQPTPVAVECNSGAERAIILVADDWADALSDQALVAEIQRTLRNAG
jgi:hypothetical protein